MASLPQPILPALGRTSSVQSVGNFTVNLINLSPTLAALASGIGIKGIKLEETFLSTNQLVPTSKRVPMIDGSTAAITNSVTAGELTFRAVRVGQSIISGDLPTIASFIQKNGDSTGSTIVIVYYVNGFPETWTFLGCTLVKAPPLNLAGNDLAVYEIVFSYDDYFRAP